MPRLLWAAALFWLAGCASDGLEVVEPPAELTEITPELEVTERWSVDIGGGVWDRYLQLTPLVDGERVYITDVAGVVAAYAADSGKRLWRATLEATVNAGPGEGGDLLLLGGDAEVFALDKANGALRWRAPVSSEVLAAPLRSGDRVLVRTVDGNLFALDAASGKVLWRYNQSVPTLSLRGTGEPALFGPYALVGYANGRLAAIDLEKGTPFWETAVAVPRGRTELERMADVDGKPAVGDGVAHVGAFQGRVSTVALANGELIWVRELPTHQPLAINGPVVFVTDDASDLWALDRRTGGTLWHQEALHARKLTAPVTQGKYLVFGDLEGYVHWIDQEDGRVVARVKSGTARILAPPAAEGRRVYAFNVAGELVAYDVDVLSQ